MPNGMYVKLFMKLFVVFCSFLTTYSTNSSWWLFGLIVLLCIECLLGDMYILADRQQKEDVAEEDVAEETVNK